MDTALEFLFLTIPEHFESLGGLFMACHLKESLWNDELERLGRGCEVRIESASSYKLSKGD